MYSVMRMNMYYRRLNHPGSVPIHNAFDSSWIGHRTQYLQHHTAITAFFSIAIGIVLALPAASSEPTQSADKKTAFDLYVATPDKAFSWKLVRTHDSPEATTYVVDMTSQRWRTADEVLSLIHI